MPLEFVAASFDRQGLMCDCREILLGLPDIFPFGFWRGTWRRTEGGAGRDGGVLEIAEA